MTSEQLFTHIVHRLNKYSDAVVLGYLLHDHGDERQVKSSAVKISLDALNGQISPKQVQRSLTDLADLGLIDVKPHPNYRTVITVNRDALVEFLNREPLSTMLPGLRATPFPFLDAINASPLAAFKGSDR
ncbi:hypothetical protein G7048_23720 [Diaphorobacter sp. HDW4B]|uniref:hypothetical protein n=1 Tax=Diaphorobacter sp. HDW4B TaxID=2714925 RepID=UPI00140D998B|nr:hypothetical protein [Diaphorobacter sp. HDW4B]QIL73096.1 hypothetical protein G7048_23720 [Diaphorobacter sp. HDW4B]